MKVIEGLKKADLDWFPNAHDDILYECLCQTLTSVRTVCLYSKRSLTKFWSSQGETLQSPFLFSHEQPPQLTEYLPPPS